MSIYQKKTIYFIKELEKDYKLIKKNRSLEELTFLRNIAHAKLYISKVKIVIFFQIEFTLKKKT